MQYMEIVANEYLGYAEEQHCVDKLVNMTCKHCCQAPKESRGLGRKNTCCSYYCSTHMVCAFVPMVSHVPTSPHGSSFFGKHICFKEEVFHKSDICCDIERKPFDFCENVRTRDF